MIDPVSPPSKSSQLWVLVGTPTQGPGPSSPLVTGFSHSGLLAAPEEQGFTSGPLSLLMGAPALNVLPWDMHKTPSLISSRPLPYVTCSAQPSLIFLISQHTTSTSSLTHHLPSLSVSPWHLLTSAMVQMFLLSLLIVCLPLSTLEFKDQEDGDFYCFIF